MRITHIAAAVALVLSGAIAIPDALAQGRAPLPRPGGGGGGKPPVEVSNNLSYPAVFTTSAVTLNGEPGAWLLEGAWPTSMSFGCAQPETIGTSTYPNTSCVDAAGTPLSLAACTAGPCAGFEVHPIYWQRNSDNDWQAETIGPNAGPTSATHLDWGDNLESVSWRTSSVIRVETTPFTTVAPGSELTGFQMWHVRGQGQDELWGVRGVGTSSDDPYVYDSPYAVIHTPNARLNIAKLVNAASACPSVAPATPPAVAAQWAGGAWSGLYTLRDIAYTAELNIGGKFVYGYNWMLGRDALPMGVDKAGWWRLTFYTSNGAVAFAGDGIPTAPPVLPDAGPPTLVVLAEGESGPLYAPRVDAAAGISWIDICIVEGQGGGGGGGGGRPRIPR